MLILNNKLVQLMFDRNIPVNIITVCIGFYLGYIDFEIFKNYGLIKYLEDKDIEKAIKLSLFEARDSCELRGIIKRIFDDIKQERPVNERDKWLYVNLLCAKKAVPNPKELLLRVSEIYTDFDYPASMRSFIYYMPPSGNYNSTQFTVDENRERLVKLLENYLERLEEKLRKTAT